MGVSFSATIELNAALRTIDANLNRAREAMRVMEEYARFMIDDALLASACKDARHDLANTAREFEKTLGGIAGDPQPLGSVASPAPLIAHRDIVGDVGQSLSTPAEMERQHPDDVVTAAGKRLSEALRAIEEYGKVLDQRFAAAIEKLRYRGYELERRLAITRRAREQFLGVRLYVLLTEALCKIDWLSTAKAVLDGGADCLQLREKQLTDRELLNRARCLTELCRERGKMLLVNDRPDIAVAAKAHGVHVGQEDLPIAAVRRLLPPGGIVGISTHTAAQVAQAAAKAPDYIAVGPMFATETKPQPEIARPELLTAARRLTSLPLVAIGGITAENAGAVVSAGPNCLCVCSAIIGANDPAAAARELRAKFDAVRSGAEQPR